MTYQSIKEPSELTKRWTHRLLIGGLGGILFTGLLLMAIWTGGYLYCKPRIEMAKTFDLVKLERLNLEQDRVPLAAVSTHFTNALLAAEDPRFFRHRGIDWHGIALGIRTGSGRGSTITQHLVRLAFTDEFKQTISQLVIPLFVARRVEMELNKEQILELYINRIYFGEDYYGIAAGARGYFGKSPKSLSIGEAATLVGMIRNPEFRSPRRHPEASRVARDYVLTEMRKLGFIDNATLELVLNEVIEVVNE